MFNVFPTTKIADFEPLFTQYSKSTETTSSKLDTYDVTNKKDGTIILSINALGLSLDDIKITNEKTKLKIVTLDTKKKSNPLSQSFGYSFTLGRVLDADSITASLKHGILEIKIKKLKEKTIPIKNIEITE